MYAGSSSHQAHARHFHERKHDAPSYGRTWTLKRLQILHNQSSLISPHEFWPLASNNDELTVQTGCRKIQTIAGYMDVNTYADFQPLKYVPKPAQAKEPTPARNPAHAPASGGASTAASGGEISTSCRGHPYMPSAGDLLLQLAGAHLLQLLKSPKTLQKTATKPQRATNP